MCIMFVTSKKANALSKGFNKDNKYYINSRVYIFLSGVLLN